MVPWIPEQVQDEDFSIKRKNCANIGKQSLLQYCNVVQFVRLVFYETMDPTLHHKMKADEVYDGSGKGLQSPYRTRQTRGKPMMDVAPRLQTRRHKKQQRKQKPKQKHTVVSVDREHRDGCTN